jgi:NAD(P)H dehydrogenase (quinone)
MAKLIGEGAKKQGVEVEIKSVEDCIVDDLLKADGVVIGSPTYFSNVSWQIKKLIDESITLYRKDHKLKGKVAGFFTSSGTQKDGEDCIRMLEVAFGYHHEMNMLPGISRAEWGKDEKIAEMCIDYGKALARLLL